ncbi:MAG: DMT family transporter [Peptococcaceae bacterium]|nr:DMT family transporter [Peptococcaceae bacterium]
MKQEHIGAALMLLSAVCYGFMAIFVKLAYTGHVNLITALSVRFVLASLFMWLVVLANRQPVSLSRREVASFILLSLLGYGTASTFFFSALWWIPASLVLFIHPVMVSLCEVAFYRYPLNIQKVSALGLTTAGLVLVLGNTSGGFDPR